MEPVEGLEHDEDPSMVWSALLELARELERAAQGLANPPTPLCDALAGLALVTREIASDIAGEMTGQLIEATWPSPTPSARARQPRSPQSR